MREGLDIPESTTYTLAASPFLSHEGYDMRSKFALAAVLFASVLCDKDSRAEEPIPAGSCVSTSLQAPPAVPPPAVPVPPCQPGVAYAREPWFAIELMLGQQTGVRGQVTLFGNAHEALVVEGFYGVLFHDLGSAQALGTGARYLVQSTWFDCVNSLQFGPGLDVFFQLNHNGLILLAPSIDLAWLVNIGGGIEWEIGLDAGLGIGVAGHTHHGNAAAGDLTPLISVYTGLRF
jgi:hypothetical protein